MFHNYKIRNLNIKLIIAAFLLTLIGLAVVTSANSDYMKNQILGMALGLAAMAVVAMIDYDFILQFSWLYYVGDVVILVVVLLFGHDSRRCPTLDRFRLHTVSAFGAYPRYC